MLLSGPIPVKGALAGVAVGEGSTDATGGTSACPCCSVGEGGRIFGGRFPCSHWFGFISHILLGHFWSRPLLFERWLVAEVLHHEELRQQVDRELEVLRRLWFPQRVFQRREPQGGGSSRRLGNRCRRGIRRPHRLELHFVGHRAFGCREMKSCYENENKSCSMNG